MTKGKIKQLVELATGGREELGGFSELAFGESPTTTCFAPSDAKQEWGHSTAIPLGVAGSPKRGPNLAVVSWWTGSIDGVRGSAELGQSLLRAFVSLTAVADLFLD